jgi:hypothetical protein
MVDLYPVTALTTAREEAAARVGRKTYDKWVGKKTRADQVATDAEANPVGVCVLRPGSCGEVVEILAAMRVALAFVEVHMATFERILERKGLVVTAAAGKGSAAEEDLVGASGFRELMAGLELFFGR